MNPAHLFKMSATAHRVDPSGGTEDEYGNPTPSSTDVEFVCHARQVSADERTEGLTAEEWILTFGPDVELDADDRVTVADQTFAVLGQPTDRTNPRTGITERRAARLVVTS